MQIRAETLMGSDQGLICATACAILDLTAVEGVLTTLGSPIFKDHIPARWSSTWKPMAR
jgi:amidase